MEQSENNMGGDNEAGASRRRQHTMFFSRQFRALVKDYKLFGNYWTEENQSHLLQTIRLAMIYLILPCSFVAALLFYVFDNPPCGTEADGCRRRNETDMDQTLAASNNNTGIIVEPFEPIDHATVSWWLLYLGVRLPITLILAVLTQVSTAACVDYGDSIVEQ
jgi:Na+/H+ antiporter NhaC